MTKHLFVLAILVSTAVASTGCMTQPDGGPEATTSIVERINPPGQLCFICDLDPSIGSCSSNASYAQRLCERACVVCDVFAGHTDCFQGTCEPQLALTGGETR